MSTNRANYREPIVFIVDDDQGVRDALAASLRERGLTTQCYASAEAFLAAYHPDQLGCVVLDVRMAGMNGLELQRKLTDLRIPIPVIFMTGHGDVALSVKAIKGGALNFIEKPFQQEELLQSIEEAFVLDRERRALEVERRKAVDQLQRLTPREWDVLRELVTGAANATNKEIARRLNISHRTVAEHRANIMAKTQAQSVTQLAEMARLCGGDALTS